MRYLGLEEPSLIKPKLSVLQQTQNISQVSHKDEPKNKNYFRAIMAQLPANMALWLRVQFVPMYAHNSRR
jgi:hypothetical protein